MPTFYFNDCLPPCANQHEFIGCLSDTLIEFNKLVDKNWGVEKVIVTEKLPSKLSFGNAYTLENTLNGIIDRDLKRLAFSYFNKYPVDLYFKLEDEPVEKIFNCNYSLNINGYNYDALNVAMVAEKGGFLFTVGLHTALKQNSFELIGEVNCKILEIHNLYGASENTAIIETKIEHLYLESLSNIDKLKRILGDYVFSTNFEKDFSKLNPMEQVSIVEDFEKARRRGLLSPFYPDTKIIKEVTPDKPKCKVSELRVYSPTALRVYFNESNNKVFVSSIGFKSNTDQNEDIKKAHSTLNKLILTT
ncbi:MAG: hypothetical protein U5L45_08115 [Saprospiraceae bacterium]|nr:hypothetical protein [Saprospiraceae bacterium]